MSAVEKAAGETSWLNGCGGAGWRMFMQRGWDSWVRPVHQSPHLTPKQVHWAKAGQLDPLQSQMGFSYSYVPPWAEFHNKRPPQRSFSELSLNLGWSQTCWCWYTDIRQWSIQHLSKNILQNYRFWTLNMEHKHVGILSMKQRIFMCLMNVLVLIVPESLMVSQTSEWSRQLVSILKGTIFNAFNL